MYIIGIGGAMIIAIMSFVATGLILLKVYWKKVCAWFSKKKAASETQQEK